MITMQFRQLREKMQEHFAQMTAENEYLFQVDVDAGELWELYLNSFPAGTNPILRTRREFDCLCCRRFIRDAGNLVAIRDNQIHTIWELEVGNDTFQAVADAMDACLRTRPVRNRFVTKNTGLGTALSYSRLEDGTVQTWDHFYLKTPASCKLRGRKSIGTVQNEYRTKKQVFQRSLEEISLEALDIVLELITQNALYRGEEWKQALTKFRQEKVTYERVPAEEQDNYTWFRSAQIGDVVSRIRNHSMGVLLTELSRGDEVDAAVKHYEDIVAPTNYKRPKAIVTKRMLEEAQKTVQELGYMESLPRRFATLDDITVNNILFSNKDAAKRIRGSNIFEELVQEQGVSPKQFSRAQEVSAEQFVRDILPGAVEVEVLLENRHAANLVSLTAPQDKTAKSMFKWNNPFGWAYTGNLTDGDIRENVKRAGGRVDGVLRFSIQWNDMAGDWDRNDLDAHCETPCHHIYYADKQDKQTGGSLDVDIIHPHKDVPAVENIVWPSRETMVPGTYRFYVHNFSHRGGRNGFRAEIEMDGVIYSYDYAGEVRQNESVEVAVVRFDGQSFTIQEKLTSEQSVRKLWGLNTKQFVPVSVICYSPNYWDEQQGVGHRHYFFLLKDCVNPEAPNGFYNEFLKKELEQHRRVFEVLGAKMAVADCEDQLSGLGFSATRRSELIVRVKGATQRVLNIKF